MSEKPDENQIDKEHGLESLQVWQQAREFAVWVNRTVLPLLPVEEKWNLTNQLRRSAQSIPANIAEGYGRYYYQDGIRFCYIARGSLEETWSHLRLAHDLGYSSNEIFAQANKLTQEVRRLLNGYIAFLKRSKRGENEPGSNLRVSEPSDYYDTTEPLT